MYRPLEVFGAFRNLKQDAQTYYGSFGSSKLDYTLTAALREGDGRGDGRDGRGDGRGQSDKMSQVFGAKIPAGSCPAPIFRIPGTIRVHNFEEKYVLLSRIVQR